MQTLNAQPDSTDAVVILKPGAIGEVVIGFHVCNVTGTAATFRLFLDPFGTDDNVEGTGEALFYDYSVAANDSYYVTCRWYVPSGGSMSVRSGTASALTFFVFTE